MGERLKLWELRIGQNRFLLVLHRGVRLFRVGVDVNRGQDGETIAKRGIRVLMLPVRHRRGRQERTG